LKIVKYKKFIRENGLEYKLEYVKEQQSYDKSHPLYEKNILVSAIRPPTVPKDTSRLRISITASHTKKDITLLLNTIKNIQSGDC